MDRLTLSQVRSMARISQQEWDARMALATQDFRDLIASHARVMRRLGHDRWNIRWMIRAYKGAMKFRSGGK